MRYWWGIIGGYLVCTYYIRYVLRLRAAEVRGKQIGVGCRREVPPCQPVRTRTRTGRYIYIYLHANFAKIGICLVEPLLALRPRIRRLSITLGFSLGYPWLPVARAEKRGRKFHERGYPGARGEQRRGDTR
ncbi:hypothetical protein GGS23DRAFT_555652 [Durotheca rogersii]|uniref:uncharacterized protein n=1 Tax=Durotheca rogersii TaxID=419775 RepID=UPI00222016C0|nr:uncharacterized protein GGS23DRAFT_555652 [Durotheca rogersii]KAI5866123.1 hypothetical protein GGS23DRAFT_555652 [Durotheca rogersii]